MLISTTDTLPGYELRVGLGPVSGSWSRTSPHSQMATSHLDRTMLAEMQSEGDQEALRGLLRQAAARGANGVIGLHYKHIFLTYALVSTAYATAVRALPVTPEAVAQYEAMAQAGQVTPL